MKSIVCQWPNNKVKIHTCRKIGCNIARSCTGNHLIILCRPTICAQAYKYDQGAVSKLPNTFTFNLALGHMFNMYHSLYDTYIMFIVLK